MYLIGVCVFIIFLGIIAAFNTAVFAFVDPPSLLVVLGLTLPMMMASGLLPDFLKGFHLMGLKVNPYSQIELNRIYQANRLATSAFLLSGLIGTLMGSVALLANVSDAASLLPGFAVASLTTLYALIFVFLILPIQAKVQAILSTLE